MERLSDPMPRPRPRRNLPHPWCVTNYIELPRDFTLSKADLIETLDQRRSRRRFGRLDLRSLSRMLWACSRSIFIDSTDPNRRQGPTPTAGGLGSVRTVIVSREWGSLLYDASRHGMDVLDVPQAAIDEVLRQVGRFMEPGAGCLALFVADRGYIEQYYQEPASLVLREAGALGAYMALVCEASDLAFCLLGTQGSRWASMALGVNEELVIPGGAALLGSRETATVG